MAESLPNQERKWTSKFKKQNRIQLKRNPKKSIL